MYFLTACALHRRQILANKTVHEGFTEFAKRAAERGVLVGRYVILPDHIHLFAAFRPGSPGLSDWMKGLKRTLAARVRRDNIEGEAWQKGFFDHVMRSEESYEQKWRYVQENPVRAGLVEKWRDWPYQGEIHPLAVRKL